MRVINFRIIIIIIIIIISGHSSAHMPRSTVKGRSHYARMRASDAVELVESSNVAFTRRRDPRAV